MSDEDLIIEEFVKKCTHCQIEKPLSEFYTQIDRFMSHCKQCVREASSIRSKTPKYKEMKRNYYILHKEEAKTYRQKYYEENKESISELQKS